MFNIFFQKVIDVSSRSEMKGMAMEWMGNCSKFRLGNLQIGRWCNFWWNQILHNITGQYIYIFINSDQFNSVIMSKQQTPTKNKKFVDFSLDFIRFVHFLYTVSFDVVFLAWKLTFLDIWYGSVETIFQVYIFRGKIDTFAPH